MRLFIAINFNAEMRSQLVALRNKLRIASAKGRFSSPENLHLTIVFLGECDEERAFDAVSAMDAVRFKPFAINIGSIGRFRRDGGDIWWAGVSDSEELTKLHGELVKKLTEFGFQIERRKFKPHITLGREVVTEASPRKFKEFGQTVYKIELMKSERVAGKLTYTTIYESNACDTSSKER